MKTMFQLPELAAELRRELETKADYVADTRSLRIVASDDGTRLEVMGIPELDGAIRPTEYAHGQISARLGIPKQFYDRLRGDDATRAVYGRLVNGLFEAKPERRLLRTMDGKLRAFLSDRFRIIDNWDLAEVVLPILGSMPDARIESCALTETRMYIKAVLPRIEAEVKVGDVVQAGIMIRNSEVGAGMLEVAPFLFRLVCLNGMTLADYGTKKYHLGARMGADSEDVYRVLRDETIEADNKALLLKIQDVVRAVADEAIFSQIVARCKELAEIRIEANPLEAVERLATKSSLSDVEKGSVLQHLVEGGDLSLWGLVNAVTRSSQDDHVDYERASELERLGGQISEWSTGEIGALIRA